MAKYTIKFSEQFSLRFKLALKQLSPEESYLIKQSVHASLPQLLQVAERQSVLSTNGLPSYLYSDSNYRIIFEVDEKERVILLNSFTLDI
jgi:mRNA-degrading endonuclease RelE of RelBE toxin-antitoxin system